jgi:hypothetical protein
MFVSNHRVGGAICVDITPSESLRDAAAVVAGLSGVFKRN